MRVQRRSLLRGAVAMLLLTAVMSPAAWAQSPRSETRDPGRLQPGRSDPSFSQPSIAPGVDYTVPTEADIKAVLDRIRAYFVRATPYRIINTDTNQPIPDLSRPIKAADRSPRGRVH